MANLHNISAFNFLQANMHALQLESIENSGTTPPDPDDDHGGDDPQTEDNSTELLAFLTKQ